MVINFKLHVKQELTLHTTVKLSYCPMQLLPVMMKAGLGGTIIKKINASHSFFFLFIPVPLILKLKAVGSLVPAQLEAVMLAS